MDPTCDYKRKKKEKPQPQCSLCCAVLGSEQMALRARRDSARAKYKTIAKVRSIGLVL